MRCDVFPTGAPLLFKRPSFSKSSPTAQILNSDSHRVVRRYQEGNTTPGIKWHAESMRLLHQKSFTTVALLEITLKVKLEVDITTYALPEKGTIIFVFVFLEKNSTSCNIIFSNKIY